MNEKNLVLLLHIAYRIGIIADGIVTIGLLLPEIIPNNIKKWSQTTT